jgi:hypothetical protein
VDSNHVPPRCSGLSGLLLRGGRSSKLPVLSGLVLISFAFVVVVRVFDAATLAKQGDLLTVEQAIEKLSAISPPCFQTRRSQLAKSSLNRARSMDARGRLATWIGE